MPDSPYLDCLKWPITLRANPIICHISVFIIFSVRPNPIICHKNFLTASASIQLLVLKLPMVQLNGVLSFAPNQPSNWPF